MAGEAFALKQDGAGAPDDDKFGAKLESVGSGKMSHLLADRKVVLGGMRSIGRSIPQERMVAI